MRIRMLTVAALAALALPAVASAQAPDRTDRRNAAQECRALRAAMGAENFANTYGTNGNRRNAFGRCVSRQARDEAREGRAARANAARTCRAERNDPAFAETHGGQTFQQHYGRNRNGRDAFGRCVSQHARANEREADAADRDRVNAARACRAEQRDPAFADSHEGQSFAEHYGTNRNNRNAFGRCVSRKARELAAQRRQEREQQEQQEQQQS